MGNKFRQQVKFQLFNVPNDMKHQAQRAGKEWAQDGAYCAHCKEWRKPSMLTVGKDPKDGRRFVYMLCEACVQGLDKAVSLKPEEFLKDALGNILAAKATHEQESDAFRKKEIADKAEKQL